MDLHREGLKYILGKILDEIMDLSLLWKGMEHKTIWVENWFIDSDGDERPGSSLLPAEDLQKKQNVLFLGFKSIRDSSLKMLLP